MLTKYQLMVIKIMVIIITVTLAAEASATGVMSPSSASSVESLWNDMFGNSTNFSNFETLIKTVCSAIAFFFTAWVSFGLYVGSLVDKSISGRDAFIMFIRLMVFITLAIYIFTR